MNQREHVLRELLRVFVGDVHAVVPFEQNLDENFGFVRRRILIRLIGGIVRRQGRRRRKNQTIGDAKTKRRDVKTNVFLLLRRLYRAVRQRAS